MRVSMLTLGTRGDVQPYVALGRALRARGHDVVLAAPDDFGPWIERHGLGFHAMGVNMRQFLQMAQIREVLSGNWLRLGSIWTSTVVPMINAMLQASWAAAGDADTIVYHPKVFGAADVGEKTGARLLCASPVPVFPTRDFPLVTAAGDYAPWLNRLSWAPLRLSRTPYAALCNRWRRETLGLGNGPRLSAVGRHPGTHVTRLCAVSPSVVPTPRDWDRDTRMVGYWFLDESSDWQPGEALEAFLDGDEAPVYIGFGSMTVRDPGQLAAAVVGGIRQAGVRAIVATGWGGLGHIDARQDIHVIESAPHAALFARVSAVVHHGGAGTTAAGLCAGRPTLVCPQSVDQPFWGRRVWRLGCGPEPLPLRQVTAHSLAGRLRELVSRERFRTNAATLARSIDLEDGITEAVAIIEAGERPA